MGRFFLKEPGLSGLKGVVTNYQKLRNFDFQTFMFAQVNHDKACLLKMCPFFLANSHVNI